jgi:TorA maturation chaperone TorD
VPPEALSAAPDPSWLAVAWLFRGDPGAAVEAAGDRMPDHLAKRIAAADPVGLEQEYVRLFVNDLPAVSCPPYASVHLEGTLHGSATREVRDLYRKWGVSSNDVPDHFAVQAAFLAGLMGAGADAGEEAERDRGWLLEHLRSWAPEFLDSVEAHDRTGVYADAARWARSLL